MITSVTILILISILIFSDFFSAHAEIETILTLNPIPSVPWGQTVTVTGILTNNTGVGLAGKTITFTGTGVSNLQSLITNPDGTFTVSATAPSTVATGWTAQAHFAGDSLYGPGTSAINNFNTTKHRTAISLKISPDTILTNSTYQIVGALKDVTTNTLLSSQTIRFGATSPIVVPSAVTDSTGKFTISGLIAPSTAGSYTIQTVFSTTPLYEKSFSAKKTLTVSLPRPNIIVIMTDDQRLDDFIGMPNVRTKIVNKGINFTNFFVSNPLCCPSRSTFLTGQYSHNHGVIDNLAPNGGATKLNDTSTLAVWLNNAGYTTSLVGKYMNGYQNMAPKVPPGWNDWHVFYFGGYYNYSLSENGIKRSFGSSASDYGTDVIKDRALNFVKTAKRPFFLEFAPYAPHTGNNGYPEVAPRHIGTCDNLERVIPLSFNEQDVSDKPSFIQNANVLNQKNTNYLNTLYQKRICSLKAVDEAIGSILDMLGPELNNTFIIFTSDNGFLLGEHRLGGKSILYEESIRVPLLIRYSSFVSENIVNDKLVSNIDLASTISELAGIVPPSNVDGTSLFPLLHNENTSWRNDILLENLRPDSSVPTMSAVRTIEFKYTELDTGEKELYDLRVDPYELDNQINNSSYTIIRDLLAQRLTELKQQ